MNKIKWVKDLGKAELCYINLLTHCQIYHYNLRFEKVRESLYLSPAEVIGITKVTVRLRTKDNKAFSIIYFLPDADAKQFQSMLEADFTEIGKEV